MNPYSHSSPLQCGVISTGDSPPQTCPNWVFPIGSSFSWTVPASFSWTVPAWILPWGAVPQEQAGFPRESQMVTANLLQCGFISPWGHRWCVPSTGFPRDHSLLWSFTCSVMGSSRGFRGFILCCLEHLLPLLSVISVSTGLFLSHIPPSTAVPWKVDFFPVFFSNLFSQRYYHCHGWALPQPAADQPWSWLALSGSVRQEGCFWQLLTETSPVVPLLPNLCHANP